MLAESEGDRREEQRAAFELNYGMTFIWSFPQSSAGEKPASGIARGPRTAPAEALPGARFLAAFDNHDLANDQYDDRIEKLGPERIEAALAFCFALDGVPLLYCGRRSPTRTATASSGTVFTAPGSSSTGRTRSRRPANAA